jgi:hypothetical protein
MRENDMSLEMNLTRGTYALLRSCIYTARCWTQRQQETGCTVGAMRKLPVAPAEADDLQVNIHALMQRVAELEARAAEGRRAAPSLGFSDDKLAAIATSIYRTRQNRLHYFDPTLFAEPAWDMLLDLFINKVRGARVSTTSLCIAAAAPQATGIRWIGLLEEQGLLRRYRAPDDARLMLIEITPRCYQLMRQCLGDSVTRFEMPIPD